MGELSPPDGELITDMAAEILSALSGYQFASQDEALRPARLAGCICNPNRCACNTNEFVFHGWVQSITSVTIDGVLQDAAQYALYDNRRLVRSAGADGGRLFWPCCQRLDLPLTEPGTWGISYIAGRPIPAGGKRAAREFACELAKAQLGDDSCKLPAHLQTITRQGITMAVLDAQEYYKEGRTGLTPVDSWLAAVNPMGLRRGARIMSPDSMVNHST